MASSLLKRAGRAAALNTLGNWFGLVGGFVSIVVIARLLTPADFGIFGMALVTFAIPEILSTGSLNQCLIQRRDLRPGHINSVFIQSLLLASIFFVALLVAAPFIAARFSSPELAPILRVFSVVLFIGALSSVPSALLQRDLKYRQITIVDISGTAAAAVVGIALALYFQNSWALVGMEIARRTVRLFAFLWFAKWWPSLRSSWAETAELTRFNAANVTSRLVQTVSASIPRILVGGMLGATALGLFNMSMRLREQAVSMLVAPMAAVALPVAAQAQNDMALMQKAFEGAIRLTALIAYPAFIGAAVIAPVAVPLMFGPQWTAGVPIIQVALLMGLRAPTTSFNSGVLIGMGRPAVIMRISIVALIATTGLVVMAINFGLMAVMLALFLAQFLTWVMGALAVKSAIGFSIRRQAAAGSTALLASIIMGTLVWLTQLVIPGAWSELVKLFALLLVGATSYVASLALLAPEVTKRFGCAAVLLSRGRSQDAMQMALGVAS
jgi:O-antigen/teichoic acid export membrane protein